MPREQKTPEPAAVVPIDAINEQVIIAAACVDRNAADELLPVFAKETFHARGHARIWEILRAMRERGLYYDPATVAQMSNGDVDIPYLEALVKQRCARPPNLSHHVDALQWDQVRIELARGPVPAMLEALKDPTAARDRLRGHVSRMLDLLQGHGTAAYLESGASVAARQMAVIRDRVTGRACYPYGIESLDFYPADEDGYAAPRMVPGASPGTITLITGVSSSGKSTFTIRLALGLALQQRRVLMGAWEMGEGNAIELMAAMHIGMSRADLLTGRFDGDDEQALEQAMADIAPYVSFYKLPRSKSRARGERYANDSAIDLMDQIVSDAAPDVLIADLLQRMFKETGPEDEMEALFRIQDLVKARRFHLIADHQQRMKDVEARRDPRPTREGAKGSSAWIEVSDCVMGTHRPAMWKRIPDDTFEVLIMKQRYGDAPIGVRFEWDPVYATFCNGQDFEYSMLTEEESPLDRVFKGGKSYST